MQVSIRKQRSSPLDKKMTQLHKVNKQSIQVGHFAEQGEHYSGYTYVELLRRFHLGLIPGQPARQILPVLIFSLGNLNSNTVKGIRNYWLRTLDTKWMLEALAIYIGKREKSLFGEPSYPYMPPDSSDTPLLEEGDLRDATAYRTSIDKTIHTVP